MPFSRDLHSMLMFWQASDLGDFPPVDDFLGTAVGDALVLAMQNLS
ncbi:MAG: hypothetical protein GXP45_07810 [bacterium]|nr:hypothetical protein [bacterium]